MARPMMHTMHGVVEHRAGFDERDLRIIVWLIKSLIGGSVGWPTKDYMYNR